MVDLPDDEYEERVARAKLAREEARQTIDAQTQTLSDIDEKAIQIFRINLLVAGILVSGFSITISTDAATFDTLITPYTTLSGIFLFVSTILASMTYTSTSQKIGIAKNAIHESILNLDFDYDLVEEEIALAYGRMIDYNYEKNASNAFLFTLTLIAAVGAICYLVIGVLEIYDSEMIAPWINVGVGGFFILLGKFSGLYGTTVRWWRLTQPLERLSSWFVAWQNKISTIIPRGKDS